MGRSCGSAWLGYIVCIQLDGRGRLLECRARMVVAAGFLATYDRGSSLRLFEPARGRTGDTKVAALPNSRRACTSARGRAIATALRGTAARSARRGSNSVFVLAVRGA